jgi:hypothetical protein
MCSHLLSYHFPHPNNQDHVYRLSQIKCWFKQPPLPYSCGPLMEPLWLVWAPVGNACFSASLEMLPEFDHLSWGLVNQAKDLCGRREAKPKNNISIS